MQLDKTRSRVNAMLRRFTMRYTAQPPAYPWCWRRKLEIALPTSTGFSFKTACPAPDNSQLPPAPENLLSAWRRLA